MAFPLKRLVKLTLSIGLLWWLFTQAGMVDTFKQLPPSVWWVVLPSVLVYLISQAVSGYRWRFLAQALNVGGDDVGEGGFGGTVRQYIDLYMVGMFFNLFLPGSIGGDGARVYYLAKQANRPKRQAVLTVLAERGVGLLALLLLTGGFCVLPSAIELPAALTQPLFMMCFAVVFGYVAVLFFPFQRFQHIGLIGWLQQAEIYWRDTSLMLRSVGVSFVVHALMVVIHLPIAHALGLDIDPIFMTIVYGVTALVSAVPLFFNGMGIREGAYQLLLGLAGVPSSTALAFGMMWLAVSVVTSLIGGFVFLRGNYDRSAMSSSDENPSTELEQPIPAVL